MERRIERKDMIVLMDNYSQEGRWLYESLRQSGYDCLGIVLEDDGFLPDGVISVYHFFLSAFKRKEDVNGQPKYFNEIEVPDHWEISGDHLGARIHDLKEEKGKISYAEPLYKRFVKRVDWYDKKGIVRISDHYNRYGVIYGRTVCNNQGKPMNRSWFLETGKEVIVENYIAGNIMLNDEGEFHIFSTKLDFILYFFDKTNLGQNRIFFNSLSTPFFISQRLRSPEKGDVLFWQEQTGEEIPGNMQGILEGRASRAAKIIVQKKRSYDKLSTLCNGNTLVHRLGFIFPFRKQNRHSREALICTRTDNLEHCMEIVEALPQMHFHIVALTQMSPRLMSMERENVSLYPLSWRQTVEEFFEICDFYFDINHGLELENSVYRAFLHNHLIFAFQETVHNRDCVAEEHIYPTGDVKKMIVDVRAILEDEVMLEEQLLLQREAALSESVENYRNVLDI